MNGVVGRMGNETPTMPSAKQIKPAAAHSPRAIFVFERLPQGSAVDGAAQTDTTCACACAASSMSTRFEASPSEDTIASTHPSRSLIPHQLPTLGRPRRNKTIVKLLHGNICYYAVAYYVYLWLLLVARQSSLLELIHGNYIPLSALIGHYPGRPIRQGRQARLARHETSTRDAKASHYLSRHGQ